MKPVVLAGGTGSRLWPKSRAALPKQFLALTSDKTMLQDTILRLPTDKMELPLFICNEDHRFMAAEQLRVANIDYDSIILEPVGRNTAPAIALAAIRAVQQGEDPVLLILAADHLISDHSAFHAAVDKATMLANEGKLVTFGVVPSEAHTGYGYIKSGESVNDIGFEVAEFVEKPDLATAKAYLASGNYYWNSGMFMFKASVYLRELSEHAPEIFAACTSAMENTDKDMTFIRVDAEIMPSWKIHLMLAWCLWMLVGTTLAVGHHCGKHQKIKMLRVTLLLVTQSLTVLQIAMLTPSKG
jgi:mannose-1-phosphate guanylyltransferase/mannose-6-phosphate isomerase